MLRKYSSIYSIPLLLFGPYLCSGAGNGPVRAVPKSARSLDYKSLPSDADLHYRTKWSNGVFIYIDDDPGAPSIYVFDRSGTVKFSTLIQLPEIDRMRVDDFSAAPDGSVWAGGNATSKTGQESFFLAHIAPDGIDVNVIQTTPYSPVQLSVAPDGTVWTAGFALARDGSGNTRDAAGHTHVDERQDVVRHFDSSGKLIVSAIPVSTVGYLRTRLGFLAANQDRLGWYSPTHGTGGAYVEFSPDLKVLHSYPVVPLDSRGTLVEGFALTPSGRAFVKIVHSREDGRPDVLYRLDRTANTWVPVDIPRDAGGWLPMLEGNDGESLVFTGPPDKSKLQIFEVSKVAANK